MSHKKDLLETIKTLPTLHLLTVFFRNSTFSESTDNAMRSELEARMHALDLAGERI